MDKRPPKVAKISDNKNIWKGKNNTEYLISEMNNEALQEALLFAERKYVIHFIAMVVHGDKESTFHRKINELLKEAKKRKLPIETCSKREAPKYEVLRKSFSYDTAEQ